MKYAFDVPTIFVNNYAFMREYGPPPPTTEVEVKGPAYMWDQVYLPQVQAHCESIRAAGSDTMTGQSLVATLEDAIISTAKVFRMTTVLIRAYLRPMSALIAFCEAEMGEAGAGIASRLLQGFDNATSAAGYGLSELTELAASSPEVVRALRAGEFERFESLEGAAEFLASLRQYLEAYGWRAESWARMHVPTWAEDPSVPLSLIARYLADPERSPSRGLERSALQRAEAVREAESLLPPGKLSEFRKLLDSSDVHVAVSEGRAMWQLLIVGSVRVPAVALGRKLMSSGVIGEPNDVFFLYLKELGEVATNPRSMQQEVEERKAELKRCEGLTPPGYLGVPPSMDRAPEDLRAVMRHLRGYGVTESPDERVINGMGASKGIVRGRARVLRGLNEAHRLQAGDILVCRTTAPPWTPLFAIAGAVVTDAGGILSHSAICAREFGIAAVVGTQIATARIEDGAFVIVDGEKGTVTLDA
jgi:pyruvate,water dikinase